MTTAPLIKRQHMPPPWRIMCELYHEMIAKGVLTENHHGELIDGQLILKMPIGPSRAGTVSIIERLLNRVLDDRFIVRGQNPITIHDYSEPEPDVVVAKFRDDFYRNAHPGPDDILLVIEVADSSLAFDRDAKIPLYAACGIQEAWLFDLVKRHLQVFRKPEGASYTESFIAKPGDVLSVPGVDGASIEVDRLGL